MAAKKPKEQAAAAEKIHPLFPIKKILVPIDGSENSVRAYRAALNLAKDYGSELLALNVVPMPAFLVSSPTGPGAPQVSFDQYYDFAERDAKHWIEDALSLAKKSNVRARGEVLHATTSVVKTITDNAENEKVDLIVIGTRGLGGFRRLIIGSVSSGVVSHAHCAVLVVR